MKTISLFRRGQPFFCPFLIGCLLFTALAARPATLLRAGAFETVAFQSMITGTVSDATGPLPGVAVSVRGTGVQALTDADGRYAITASKGDILAFSYIGYGDIERVAGSTPLNAVLVPNAQSLQEVTVNAGYYKVKDKERTGNIARITAKDIESQPVTNVLAAMQGRMAGVSITQSTGMPGGGFDIKIRGQNSLRADGNSPLYIIDGVPYDAQSLTDGFTSGVLAGKPSPLHSIPPDQVASLEVLKDADATAIYGSRGANGVVLITTKKGKGGKTAFNVRFTRGAGQVTRFMKLLNTEQYLSMRREAFANDGITDYPDYAYDVNGTWDANRYTDWQETLLGGMAEFSTVQASIGGGSERTSFLINGGFSQQGTVFPGNFSYKTGNARAAANHGSADGKFSLSFSAGLSLQDSRLPGTDLAAEAVRLAPNAPALYDEQGALNWEDNTFNNPLRNTVAGYGSEISDLVASMRVSYALGGGLEAIASFGYTTASHADRNTVPSTASMPVQGSGPGRSYIAVTDARRSSWIAEPQLRWEREWGAHRVDVLVGGTFQSQHSESLVLMGMGFSSNSLIGNLAAASQLLSFGNDRRDYRYQAFFGRANYTLGDRYILNVTGRRDGSSRFGPGRRFANFGAAGAAWLFHKEAFAAGSRWLSFGKLRTSWGTTGSDQIGDYQYLDTYGTTGVPYGTVVGLQPNRLYNPDFGWETNRKLEAGLELGFFRDRIFVMAAYYRNLSGNQLTGIPLPGTTGFQNVQANLDASVENSGIEITLRASLLEGRDWNWTASANLTAARNRLRSFPGLEGSTYASRYAIGEPLSIRKLYRFEGIDTETGLYRFADLNGDGALDQLDMLEAADFTPKYFGGLQNELRWKQLKLDFLLQFVKQQNRDLQRQMGYAGGMYNQSQVALDGSGQAYTAGFNTAAVQAASMYANSTAIVTDASFVRLKNIALSWDVPLEKASGVSCQLSVQAQNLLTLTPYRGGDPETAGSNFLAPMRTVTARISLSF